MLKLSRLLMLPSFPFFEKSQVCFSTFSHTPSSSPFFVTTGRRSAIRWHKFQKHGTRVVFHRSRNPESRTRHRSDGDTARSFASRRNNSGSSQKVDCVSRPIGRIRIPDISVGKTRSGLGGRHHGIFPSEKAWARGCTGLL